MISKIIGNKFTVQLSACKTKFEPISQPSVNSTLSTNIKHVHDLVFVFKKFEEISFCSFAVLVYIDDCDSRGSFILSRLLLGGILNY